MVNDFQQKSNRFVKWLSDFPSASISSKIALTDLRGHGSGRGVVALADIDADDELFTIPSCSIISVQKSDLFTRLPQIFKALNPWLSLIVVLIYEHLKGRSSRWKPYFDVLKANFDTLMFWTDAELEELQASAVRQKIGKEEADQTFKTTILPMIKNNSEVFFDGIHTGTPSDRCLMELSHRMASTCMAYAFDLEKNESDAELNEEGYATEEEDEVLAKAMIPMADMLNADAIFNARLYHGADGFIMKAIVRISEGEEILNDYGPLPRSDLLRRYGYITTKYAQYDVVELSKDLIVDTIQSYRKLDKDDLAYRLAYLDEEYGLEATYLLNRQSAGLGTTLPKDPDLILFMATLLAHHEDRRKVIYLEGQRKAMLRVEVGRVLALVVCARARQYSTSMAEDKSFLKDGTLSKRIRMAIEMRLGEKEILAEAATEAANLTYSSKCDADRPRTKRLKTKA